MQVISVDIPNQLTLEVTETAPGVKGNTVSGGTKAATLETGAVIQVSLSAAAGPLLIRLACGFTALAIVAPPAYGQLTQMIKIVICF